MHLLQRTTFGARPQDVEAVRRTGTAAFLDRQMHPEQISDTALEKRLASFETLSLTSKQIAEDYYQPAQQVRRRRQAQGQGAAPPDAADQEILRKERLVLQELGEQKILRAVYSERQLQEVLVDFWFNHFNVFAGKGADRGLLTAYERDAIRPNVFGRFRDLLGATAQSPAMLFYLDNWMSVDPNGPHPLGKQTARLPRSANRGLIGLALPPPRAPDERQPAAAANRPRRGLNENYARELMELHTLGADGGYTQRDVVEVARCFTGWTIRQPRDGGDFFFDERQHDPEQKVVLGHVIKPGGGKEDGERILDLLARDPHTARFIATKLARRFVADDPPAALVDRLARRFRDTDGNLREVYAALFRSPEFWDDRAYDTKIKTPLEYLASAMRVTGAEVETATASLQVLRTLGMPLYYCQQPNGYPDRADTWLNAGAVLARMNVATALADGRLTGVRLAVAALDGSGDVAVMRSTLVARVLNGDPSPATAASIAAATRAPQLLALVLGSPDFQRR
ncbi:MAG: DUF1800 domain-containing protein [Bacteroidales bacterium]